MEFVESIIALVCYFGFSSPVSGLLIGYFAPPKKLLFGAVAALIGFYCEKAAF
jgi:hypothetical protein